MSGLSPVAQNPNPEPLSSSPSASIDVSSPNETLAPVKNITGLAWILEDITAKLHKSMLGNNFSAPFSSSVSPNDGVVAVFSEPREFQTYGLNAFIVDYNNSTFRSCTFQKKNSILE